MERAGELRPSGLPVGAHVRLLQLHLVSSCVLIGAPETTLKRRYLMLQANLNQ
jgi:hypothetical protein